MSDIFISYAKEDRERAKAIAAAMEEMGWSVWWDRMIPTGKVFDDVIQEALDSAKCVIVLWSSNSVESRWVKAEAERAVDQEKLFPALIERVPIPMAFSRFQAADLVDWDGNITEGERPQLVEELGRILGVRPQQAEDTKAQSRAEPPRETLSASYADTPEPPKGMADFLPGRWNRVVALLVTAFIIVVTAWGVSNFVFVNGVQSPRYEVRLFGDIAGTDWTGVGPFGKTKKHRRPIKKSARYSAPALRDRFLFLHEAFKYGGELRIEADVYLKLEGNALTVDGECRMYEGTTEDSKDEVDKKPFNFVAALDSESNHTVHLKNMDVGKRDEATVDLQVWFSIVEGS